MDAIVPFVGVYRPFWLGLRAVGFDLVLAVLLTSLVRRRLGHRAWRGVRWLAYASWPIAVLHRFGTGSDIHRRWMLMIDIVCILAGLGKGWTRRSATPSKLLSIGGPA